MRALPPRVRRSRSRYTSWLGLIDALVATIAFWMSGSLFRLHGCRARPARRTPCCHMTLACCHVTAATSWQARVPCWRTKGLWREVDCPTIACKAVLANYYAAGGVFGFLVPPKAFRARPPAELACHIRRPGSAGPSEAARGPHDDRPFATCRGPKACRFEPLGRSCTPAAGFFASPHVAHPVGRQFGSNVPGVLEGHWRRGAAVAQRIWTHPGAGLRAATLAGGWTALCWRMTTGCGSGQRPSALPATVGTPGS